TGQIRIIDEEITTLEKLVKEGLTTKPRLLELKRDKQRLLGDRGQYTATIAKTQQSINEIEVQILNIKNDFVTQNADELKDNYSKIADLQEKLRAASDVMARTVITAPTEGIVTGL